jgi:hypothetical protein
MVGQDRGRHGVSTERRLVVATQSCRCWCPCAVTHSGPLAPIVTCLETMRAGSTVGVTLIDGECISARCLPCAMAAGWPAGTPGPMAMTAAGVAR